MFYMNEWRTYDITDYRRLDYLGKDAKEWLMMLLDNIRAGVCLFEVGEHIHALYLNNAYFECIGWEKEAYASKHDDVFSTFILEDANAFYAYIVDNVPKKKTVEYEIRSRRQDGRIGWFEVKASLIETNYTDRPVYLAVINDVSEIKEKDEQLRKFQRANSDFLVQEERYRMLEATAQGILFEYFPDKDKMVFSYNLPNNRKRKEIEHYQQYVKQFPLVHSNHIEKFTQALKVACEKVTEDSLEYLSTVSGGGYRWHVTYYKSVADNTGKIISVLGRIRDIHDAKMETERINYRAERDGLTNVYHKDVAFEKMSEFVDEAPFSKFYFAILDLDDFKKINDQFGHQYGDIVIKDFADMLNHSFAEDSIIGRFGGDEFVLLTKNIALAEVRRRLSQIQQRIHFSAGIVEWKYGDQMEKVFEKADKSMYEAKLMGKNSLDVK